VNLFNSIGDMSFSVYATNYIVLFPVLVYIAISSYITHKILKVYREINRLESISRSPIVSLYKETINGLTSIRVYNF